MSPLALSVRFLQTQPDGRLVELARAGHERAFEVLVRRYRRPLLRYCRTLSASEAGAEDALQQALLQAWIALSAGAIEVRDARAWLYRIVHNVAVSNVRRPRPDAVGEHEAASAVGAEDEFERRLAVRDALAGLAALPELQRAVMVSTALDGRSHDEVAATLGLSNGAVRGLIYRARATLRAAAAALVPGPLVNWAARQTPSLGSGGRSAAMIDAMAGGGSAGLGAVIIKGGALVATAGVLASAAGLELHPDHPAPRASRAPGVPARHQELRPAASRPVLIASRSTPSKHPPVLSAHVDERRGSVSSGGRGSSGGGGGRGGSSSDGGSSNGGLSNGGSSNGGSSTRDGGGSGQSSGGGGGPDAVSASHDGGDSSSDGGTSSSTVVSGSTTLQSDGGTTLTSSSDGGISGGTSGSSGGSSSDGTSTSTTSGGH